jgi:ABC-type enterochelin transport system permease subunit
MAESEVNVRFEPFKEIVVLQQNRFSSPDDLARFTSIVAGGKTAGLYWAEGVAFLYFLLPTSSETATKALIEHGRVYWTLVSYALMPEYKSIIETKEKIMVPVVNLSSNAVIRKVANWLKQQKE